MADDTVRCLLDVGYTYESAINAVMADDLDLLEHPGTFEVRLDLPDPEA